MKKVIIDKDFIQIEAWNILGRELSLKELEEVYETMIENLWEFVQSGIEKVVDFNELLERNKNADKTFPYYKTYYRNENAYQQKFRVIETFKTEKDAREFIHHDFITEFDEWRLVIVNDDNTEQDVYKIHC